MLNDNIVAALATLDVDNDDHWTSDGFPRVDVVQDYVKQDVTRSDITAAAKTFSRKNPELPTKSTVQPAELVEESTELTPEENADVTELPEDGTEPTEDSSLEKAFAEATAELDEARKEMNAATQRFSVAQDAVDAIIREKEKGENTAVSNLMSIKAYQRSQFELRRRQLEEK